MFRIVNLFFLIYLILPAYAFSVTAPTSGTSYEFELIKSLGDHKKPVNSVLFSPDNRFIASGSSDGGVKLWKADSGKQIKALMKHPSSILCISFSPDSNMLAVGTEAGTISLWDMNYRERIRTLKGHEGKVWSVRFGRDGKLLASGSADKTVRLWDMQSGKEIKTFRGHTDSVYSASFSPEGKVLASGSADGTIKIWDVSSGKNISTLKENTGAVHSLCFSPDGKTLASGSVNGTVRLWSLDSSAEIDLFSGQSNGIGIDDCLSFSPDGRVLASGSLDATIVVWQVSSHNANVIGEVEARRNAINSIAFSPDGRSLVSAGDNGVIKLWKILVTESLMIGLNAEYKGWQRGILKISADFVGSADLVRFQYTLDGSTWKDIAEIKEPPYSVEWDTRSSLLAVSKDIQLRAIAERSIGTSAIDIGNNNFSVDNEPPSTKHDYDGLWHKSDFNIVLSADDGDGSGLLATKYRLNYGAEKNIRKNGQPRITTEGINTLEYWSIDKLGNEEAHEVLSDVKLDKTAPIFVDWSKEMEGLLPKGTFRISVRVVDKEGSGLEGKIPQFSYHIGPDTIYDGYEDMSREDNEIWYYDIPEPASGWSQYTGKSIYYKARCEDLAGNMGESPEYQELIGSTKIPPIVKITSEPRDWERGSLALKADASDTDGVITDVRFEYSLDGIRWIPIGISSAPPYTVQWDTPSSIPGVAKFVQIQAHATDNDGFSAKYIFAFGIDNHPPNTTHDYDKLWHRTDFTISLTANDGDGSGISAIKYRLNSGYEKSVQADGQPKIDEQGENTLEYWSIDISGNEEAHKILPKIKLDRLPPSFEKNVKREGNILRVEVKISDADSGITVPPQIDYHIGSDTHYSGYKEMEKIDDAQWKYDIDISSIPDIADKILFCKVSARDAVGNLGIKTWESVVSSATPGLSPDELPQHGIIKPLQEKSEPISTSSSESKITKSSITWSGQTDSSVSVGEKVNLQGRIEPEIGKPIPVNLTLIAPNNTVYVSHIYTDSKGFFEFSAPLTSEGEWQILAGFDRDDKPVMSDAIKIRATTEKTSANISGKQAGFFKKKTMIIWVFILYVLIIGIYR